MRCPKCGFISFDHLDFCRKCQKPLASLALALRGSAYDCQAPAFLRFSARQEPMETVDTHPPTNVLEEVEIEAPGLAAISALAGDEPPAQFIKGEDDFDPDLDLDLDLGFDLHDLAQHAKFEEENAASVTDKGRAAPVDMDSDLDFELDLGGLSLRDYGDNRK